MAKSRQILNTIDTESKLEKQRAALLPKSGPSAEYLERMEEEKYKTESTKTHERYRRKQMAVGGADLSDLIRPAKEVKQKPGTYFYGTLEKLGKDFNNNIKEMTKYMTLGQCAKYSSNEQDNKIYCAKTGKMLYDCNTGESF